MTTSAFADEAPPLPTARLRQSYVSTDPPLGGLPTHFSVSTNGHSTIPLIGSLDRYPSRGNLDPRKAWHSVLAVRAGLVLSAVFLLAFAVVHCLRSGGAFVVSSNMAACEPSYDTLIPPLRSLESGGSQHLVEHEDVMGALGELRPRIAMVTMADTRKMPMPRRLSYMTGIEEGTEVDILQVVWRNRKEYADRHGYTLIDGTDLVGDDRPPAWYKIKVVESAINDFDWVFYLDSDAWITNPEIALETLLPAQGGADFVVTEDATGANSGAWFVRSSDWSRSFLKEWWGLDSFVRTGARMETRLHPGGQKGDTKSGDNDALKHLVREMDKATRARRIAYPPQCAFNSYLWRVSVRQWWRWLTAGSTIRSGIWRPGHLLVHLAGWNNYQGLLQLQRLLMTRHHFAQHSTQVHSGASRKLLQPPSWQQPPPTGWRDVAEDWRGTLLQDGAVDAASGIVRERVAADSRAVHFGSADDLVLQSRRAAAGGAGQGEPGIAAVAAGTPKATARSSPDASGSNGGLITELDVIEEGDEMYEFQGDKGADGSRGIDKEEEQEDAGEALARHATSEDGFGFAMDYTVYQAVTAKGASGAGADSDGDGADDGADGADSGVAADFGVGGDVEEAAEDARLPEDEPASEDGAGEDAAVGPGSTDTPDDAKKRELDEMDRRIDEDVDVMLRLGVNSLRKAFWPQAGGAAQNGAADRDHDVVAARQADEDGDYAVQGWVDAEPDPVNDDADDADDDCAGGDCGGEADIGQQAEARADAAAVVADNDYVEHEELIEAAVAGGDQEYEPELEPPPPRRRPQPQMKFQRRSPARSLRHRNASLKLLR